MDIYYGTPVIEWCNYKTFITEQYCTEKVVVSKEGGWDVLPEARDAQNKNKKNDKN